MATASATMRLDLYDSMQSNIQVMFGCGVIDRLTMLLSTLAVVECQSSFSQRLGLAFHGLLRQAWFGPQLVGVRKDA